MITLDPTLQTAQDSLERNPIARINSVSFADSIPFEGQAFNTGTVNEENPEGLVLSNGKVAVLFERDSDLKLLITDTENTEWFEYSVYSSGIAVMGSMIELDSGYLGIVVLDYSSTYRLRYLVITQSGAVITAATDIYVTSDWVSSPFLIQLANDTYFLVYAYKNGSNEYSIQKRTSTNFTSWTSAVTIVPSGLNDTMRMDNTCVYQLTTGEIFLLFDYLNSVQDGQELVNIYILQSTDNGASWATPVKLTDYLVYGTYAQHPSIAEKEDGSILISMQEVKELLSMNSSTPGWDKSTTSYGVSIDLSSLKIIGKQNDQIVIIDAVTWTIDKAYHDTSIPPLDYPYSSNGTRTVDSGKYSCMIDHPTITIVNTETDEIRYYSYEDDPDYGVTKNLDVPRLGLSILETMPKITHTIVDPINEDRVYFYFKGTWGSWNTNCCGYIDMTESLNPITGMYTWHGLFNLKETSGLNGWKGPKMYTGLEWVFRWFYNENYSFEQLQVLNFEGAEVYNFNRNDYAGCPYHGLGDPIYVNGHIYGNIHYEPLYGEDGRYGLCGIDLSTMSFRYHRPTWATQDNYNLCYPKDMGDGRILFVAQDAGIAIFDILTETWTLFDSTTFPEITDWTFYDLDYDPVTRIIYAAGDYGIIAFSEDGNFQQVKYLTGTYDTSWSYGSLSTLVTQYTNSQASIIVDTDDVLWAFWTNRDIDEMSLYWGVGLGEKDVTPYLTQSSVIVARKVDGLSSLSFSLSHGHLFDPTNLLSILATFLKKGRKIELQFGENISDVEYLQDQGVYVIHDTKLSHARGSYPVINVQCEDLRTVWKQGKIVATDFYSEQSPETVLSLILQDHANVDSGDISFPTIVNTHTLNHQFIDQDAVDMIDSILEHFNYFFYFEMNGDCSAKLFDLSADVSHEYTGAEIINFTPDDSYSSFLNRVIVKGEGRYEIEVLYPSEVVASSSGVVGWWGGTEVKTVYFSDDKQKRCRNPYLEVITSIQEFEIFTIQGGGKEYISGTDSEGYYVEITIECPNLVAMVIGTCVAIIAVGVAAIPCFLNCGPFLFALTVLTQILAYMLGSIATYDYEVWAKPIGVTKQTFQAQADDLIFQRELGGLIVADSIDDPFCYDISRCQTVATNELNIVKAQRKRVSFQKIAHLQDEIGDVIQIVHPYTGVELRIFIAELKRTYMQGKSFIDVIEGWLV